MTDHNDDQSANDDSLKKVLGIIKEIVEKSADGDYIYRGEPKHYCQVSSSLYRRIQREGSENVDIKRAQEEDLKEAREFVVQTFEDDDLLAQLQHYGSDTNLIDFTTDCLIALFFACTGEFQENGRVILLSRTSYPLLQPSFPENRVIAQKSIFVHPPDGTVNPNDTICIPHELKKPILEYLNKHHGINAQTIYNDLYGFIRHRQDYPSSYMTFYTALTHAKKGDYKEAIAGFGDAIELNPQLTAAYNNRGNVYKDMCEYDHAIWDFNKAIELNPNLAAAYYNRGIVYKSKKDVDRAIEDYDRAIELNPRYAEAYCNRGNAYCDKGWHDGAIKDYDIAIELNPRYALAYNSRGSAYFLKCKYESAIQDFSRAIELNSSYAMAYNNRGECWMVLKEWAKAEADLSTAVSLGKDVTTAFIDEYESVAGFEERFNVKVPSDIAAMLTPSSEE